MKRLLASVVVVLAAFVMMVSTAPAKAPTPYSTCGSNSCTGGDQPPYPCDYWHWGENIWYQGTFYYCTDTGGYYHWIAD